jgi:hypothetical protein
MPVTNSLLMRQQAMTNSPDKAHSMTADTGSHAKLPSSPVLFTTQPETREQLLGVTRCAERTLAVWSVDLTAGLFENPGFIDVLKRFILARRHARVRILTPQLPAQDDHKHALLALAERLPGSIEVRTASHPALDAAELVLSDDRGVLYRINVNRWDGMADLNDQLVARFYLSQFDTAWRAAAAASAAEFTDSLSPG